MSTQPTEPEPHVPDPNGPPVLPYCSLKTARNFLGMSVSTGLVLGIGGTAALFVLGTMALPTSGALRSQQIKWEERRNEIARAQAESDAQPKAEMQTAEQPHD